MAKGIDEGKLCAFLMYLFPIGLIWFLVDDKMRKNEFAKFHLKQSIVLLITAIIIQVAGVFIPILGWFIIIPFGGLFILILWVVGIIHALSGNKKHLPLIGRFGDKFTF